MRELATPLPERQALHHLPGQGTYWPERIGMFRTICLARHGFTSPFGKVMKSLGTLRLRADTEELVRTEAAKVGLPPLEFLRDYIEQGFHGRSVIEHEVNLRLETIDRLLPQGHRKGSQE